jgi:benzoylformate decarboxylase
MDDWSAAADEERELPAATRVMRARAADPAALAELAALLAGAKAPVLVVGAGASDPETWRGLVALAERLRCPVWQESFGARAGFPQDHPHFAGHLPADRVRLRETLAPHDLVLVVGTSAFRQYPYVEGPFARPGTRVAVVSSDPAEAHRSPADLAVLASPATVCAELARLVPAREGPAPTSFVRPAPPEPPAGDEPLRAGHVLAAMAERLPRNAILIEETPSNRPELCARIPAREPLGFLSAAMGGLGFALPAAVGLRMARPEVPVAAIVGDGSSLYGIQALWSAAHYRAGALFVILSNGGYAVMDRLVEQRGSKGPWPGFGVDVAGMSRALGCPARTITEHGDLLQTLDEVLPGLQDRSEPLLLEVAVAPDTSFAP